MARSARCCAWGVAQGWRKQAKKHQQQNDELRAVCTELSDLIDEKESEIRGLLEMLDEAEMAAARAEGKLSAARMVVGG